MTCTQIFDSDESLIEFDGDIDGGAGSSSNCSTPKERVHTSSEKMPVKRKKFLNLANFNDSGKKKKENEENATFNRETMNILRQILEKQKSLENRMTKLEIAIHEKMVDKNEMMAQTRVMRECKVMLKKVNHSVGRITGEVQDENHLNIAANFPLSTMDAAHDIEEKLNNDEYASSVKTYMFQLKGPCGKIEEVVKAIITDDLLQNFNWSGSWGKRALNKLKLFNDILYDVFNMEGRLNFESKFKKIIERSHNRTKQKAFNKKKDLVIVKL